MTTRDPSSGRTVRVRALDGVRVVDLTHAYSGPMCTMHLALSGADVIKIESPGVGDDFRARGGTFAGINGGKRSMTLDLKRPEAQRVLHRMVADADVVVENYRPGVGPKLGVDWDAFKTINPRVIFASISGYGQAGRYKDYPAIEWAVQAMSGMTAQYMSEEVDGRRLGIGVLDAFSGYVAFSAILTALLQRARTGVGQRIDVAMLDAAMVLMTTSVVGQLQGGRGADSSGIRPTMARFRAQDRTLFVGALFDHWFERLCAVLGAPELASDARFASAASRTANADALTAELNRLFALRPAADLEREIVAAGIPASIVRTIREVAAEPHLHERGALQQVEFTERGQEVTLVGEAFRFETDGPRFSRSVPALGQHTDEVLGSFGYSAADIADLRARGLV